MKVVDGPLEMTGITEPGAYRIEAYTRRPQWSDGAVAGVESDLRWITFTGQN